MRSSVSPTHLRFGILCIVGYVALSWAARFDLRLGAQIASLVYPLDTFSMYAGMPGEAADHLLVRAGSGQVYRVTYFRSYNCAEPVARSKARCANERGIIPYHYDDLADYIESHTGPGEVDVDLIVRKWKLQSGSAPEWIGDCVVTHCKVAR